jgi:hypothetical protein
MEEKWVLVQINLVLRFNVDIQIIDSLNVDNINVDKMSTKCRQNN